MKVEFHKSFLKDFKKAKRTYLLPTIKHLIEIVKNNPYEAYPPYEKLEGKCCEYSRRINEQHRLVYEISDDTIIFLHCWGHYE